MGVDISMLYGYLILSITKLLLYKSDMVYLNVELIVHKSDFKILI